MTIRMVLSHILLEHTKRCGQVCSSGESGKHGRSASQRQMNRRVKYTGEVSWHNSELGVCYRVDARRECLHSALSSAKLLAVPVR